MMPPPYDKSFWEQRKKLPKVKTTIILGVINLEISGMDPRNHTRMGARYRFWERLTNNGKR